jgi:aspartyl-tRNA(Asn)/glutamyl-tRNA(Gln) amidotransferase subunit B
MRADVNLSVREVGAAEFGTRTEMKNLNSFKAIARAIAGERERQIELLEDGKKVVQETRRWDDNKESSHAMRSKEDAQDYRYFPDPDLVPVWIADEWIDRVKANQPEMRTEKMARYQEEYALPEYDADILTGSKHLADIFEQTVAVCGQPKQVSNWLMTDAMKLLKENEQDPEDMHFSPEHLAKLIELIDKNVINRTVAHTVFEAVFKDDVDPEEYVESHGLKVVNDEGEVRAKIEEIIAANPQSVADFKAGKQKAMGFIVGQTMRAMKGKADPAVVNALVKELLSR